MVMIASTTECRSLWGWGPETRQATVNVYTVTWELQDKENQVEDQPDGENPYSCMKVSFLFILVSIMFI